MKSVRGKNKMTTGEVIQRTDTNLLLHKARVLATQRVLGGLTFVLVGFMIFNTMKMTFAGNQNVANLNLNVSAGVLEILNATNNVQFAPTAQGIAANVVQNLNDVAVSDWRSISNYEWDVTAFSNGMVGAEDGNRTISNANMSVSTLASTKTNINSFDNTKVGNGVGNTALAAINVIFNSTDTSGGVVELDGLLFKVNLGVDVIGDNYSGNVYISVIAS